MQKKEASILVVDDNQAILTAVKMLLEQHFAQVTALPSPELIRATLRQSAVDAVLLDMNFSAGINTGNEGLFWLAEIRKMAPGLPVVLFTAYADIELAVRGIKEGAADFIVKPWDNAKLVETLRLACESRTDSRRKAKADSTHDAHRAAAGGMYWGTSDAMRQLRTVVERVAATDANILITGENGTGKEVLAREIHRLSSRKGRAMVAVDMGAIAESLFESELFGHVKGAFTDARADRAGKFEAADGGTLFLDEIGNLPLHLQPKLLAALQSRHIVRVGSNTPLPVDIRLVAATNRDLAAMAAAGEFREDLLYRINTIHLRLPALRERSDDIVPMAEMFAARYAHSYGKPRMQLDKAAAGRLAAHAWYGNIRELQHAVEKAVILAETAVLTPDLFELSTATPAATPVAATTLEAMERQLIETTIAKCDGNLSTAAERLGISRQTLYNKMKRYGI